MSPLVASAIAALESESPETIGEGFLTLAEVIAVNRIGNFQSDIIPAANDEVLGWGPVEQIRDAILRWLERNPDHPQAASAFWALGKFHDRDLLPHFRHHLERYVQRILPSLDPVGQILIALNTLEVQCISKNSFSAAEHGKNLDDALAYLKQSAP